MALKHVKTASGFECDIDESRGDDYRLLKLCREADKNAAAIVDVVSLLLGEDEERLMEHLKDKAGRVPASAVVAELEEIIGQLNRKKK